uniref:Uncharacterized protein n=1 Tax=Chromera velia CCMP2878 TaxID=1169474 RepID=A0A0G4H9M8_9ALVE|eukprot:Cvel_25462.t1-p1 / transcript=Cvel_25462.t1 / gene=Cvel_25462 / organism=Chromera_velia_CCMP2878 / gene_product=hypothetical protein / transcript_product=hypothetical protein / location=Cvel_scaffold2888:5409-6101(+) / protein_length=231 / sequence_SO=supercontig / SO=protein_coding / is_pseudo=false
MILRAKVSLCLHPPQTKGECLFEAFNTSDQTDNPQHLADFSTFSDALARIGVTLTQGKRLVLFEHLAETYPSGVLPDSLSEGGNVEGSSSLNFEQLASGFFEGNDLERCGVDDLLDDLASMVRHKMAYRVSFFPQVLKSCRENPCPTFGIDGMKGSYWWGNEVLDRHGLNVEYAVTNRALEEVEGRIDNLVRLICEPLYDAERRKTVDGLFDRFSGTEEGVVRLSLGMLVV